MYVATSVEFFVVSVFLFVTQFSVAFFRLPGRDLSCTRCKTPSSTLSMVGEKAELDGDHLWRLNFSFRKKGVKAVDAVARVRFVPDRNYEPPQGKIFVQDDYNGLIKVDDQGYAGRWTLSEDKENRKDGLWVWGLFEEPKYPFLYFNLDIYNTIILPSGEEEGIYGGEGVPSGRLLLRFDHIRDDTKGSLLSGGLMNYKLTELVKADPFGVGGTVNVGDELSAGTVQIALVRQVQGSAEEESADATQLQT